jgi:hypothetical protein
VLIKQLLTKKLIFKIQDKQLSSLGTALKLQLLPGVLTWGNTPGMLMSVRSLVESSKHDVMPTKPLMGQHATFAASRPSIESNQFGELHVETREASILLSY